MVGRKTSITRTSECINRREWSFETNVEQSKRNVRGFKNEFCKCGESSGHDEI